MRVLGVDVAYALSTQAKGKAETPYRWLQDRIVRTCAIEKLTAIEEVRAVIREEVGRYNNLQVHSITEEIPGIRFEKAKREGNSPLHYPSYILLLRTSSACERHGWSTDTARYLYLAMKYQ
ncbi:hypothetical protein ACFLVX_03245 [Chloroflexota bacterium]